MNQPTNQPTNQQTGKAGEQAAAEYLQKKGWKIAARNFHAAKGELDLVAWAKPTLLVFVEVKTRGDDLYGKPHEAVDSKKQQHLARAAGAFMQRIGHEGAIRFDVISVLLRNGEVRDIQHVEDAFFPGL